MLLALIDSIEDKKQQSAMIEKVLGSSKEKKKLKQKVEALVNLAYSMTKVLSRMEQEKPLSINDLCAKITCLKLEVV